MTLYIPEYVYSCTNLICDIVSVGLHYQTRIFFYQIPLITSHKQNTSPTTEKQCILCALCTLRNHIIILLQKVKLTKTEVISITYKHDFLHQTNRIIPCIIFGRYKIFIFFNIVIE